MQGISELNSHCFRVIHGQICGDFKSQGGFSLSHGDLQVVEASFFFFFWANGDTQLTSCLLKHFLWHPLIWTDQENCQLSNMDPWPYLEVSGVSFHGLSCPTMWMRELCFPVVHCHNSHLPWCCWHPAPGISCFPWSRALSLHSSIGSRAWSSRCSGVTWSSPTPTGQIPGFSLIRVSHGITTYYLYSVFIQSLGDMHNPWEPPKKTTIWKDHTMLNRYEIRSQKPIAEKTPRFWYVKSSRNRPCSSVFQSYVSWCHWRVFPPFIAII